VTRALLLAVAFTFVTAVVCALAGRPGLTAQVFPVVGGSQAARTEIDAAPSSDSVERLAEVFRNRAARIAWDGLLHVPETRDYEIGLIIGAPARLVIDGRVVVEDLDARSPVEPSNTVTLSKGQHLLALEYTQAGARPLLELRWDVGNAYRLTSIPAEALSPVALSEWRWRLRAFTPALAATAATMWSVVIGWILWRAAWRAMGIRAEELSGATTVVLAGAGVLFAAGIWWGWPAAWAPDELDPGIVRDAIHRHFSQGWFDKYPPLHYYLLALVYTPVLIAGQLHWLNPDSTFVRELLFMLGRVLTLAMAVATLAVLAVIAERTLGRRFGWPTALCAAAFMPFVFYAKTVNVDGPYIFWFAVSLLFLVQAYERASLRATIGFGVAAAAAIATKDQAYALYVLPSLHLAWRLARQPGGVAALAAGAGAGLATLALAHNLLFNYEGFRQHVDLITGPASDDYRMFPMTAAGEWSLAKATAAQVIWTLGWPGIALILIALAPVKSGEVRPPLRKLVWIALASISYYLVFIAVVGYVYDRFLLPVTSMLALVAGAGVRRLLDDWGAMRLGRIAAALLIGWLVWRVASIDALLVRDSRYTAEAWLRAHVERHAIVASVNEFGYVPRLDEFRHWEMQPTPADTQAIQPAFIVINTEFPLRFPPESPMRTWLAWLESDASPYREVFRYKAPLRWSALAWDSRFLDRREDDFTNLDKANPEIAIFQRR
jgi:hypothetical protein